MMKHILIFIFLLSNAPVCFSQTQGKKDNNEKVFAKEKVKQNKPYKFFSSAGIFTGYESNVLLNNERKGDTFQEFYYYLSFLNKLPAGVNFKLSYDSDYLNYSEFTDYTNFINSLTVSFSKKLSFFEPEAGFNTSYIYYPHNRDDTFLFYKGFIKLNQKINRNLKHNVFVEIGRKNYSRRKALSDTISSYQDKKQRDKRYGAGYEVSFKPNKKLSIRLKSAYYLNDSNASYMDYYDYRALRESLKVSYKLTKRLKVLTGFGYQHKLYKSRDVSEGGCNERDKLYVGNLEFLYKLNRNADLSLYYSYRENSSNDDLEEYLDHTISCGIQYYF